MNIKPQSNRELAYIGVASLLPFIGQIIIVTRPKLSGGAKARSSLYSLVVSFILLLLLPVSEPEKQAKTVAIAPDSLVIQSPIEDGSEVASFIPMASCGNVDAEADRIYPVFLDGADLSKTRAQFCSDAISSVRQDTGNSTVILASFDTLKEAQKFADRVGGEVGEADFIAKEPETVIKTEVVKQASEPEPLSASEQLRRDIISNTPGILAQEKISFIPADALADKVIPATCDMLAATTATETELLLADAARKNWQADEKQAANIAKGIVDTALEPGRCL